MSSLRSDAQTTTEATQTSYAKIFERMLSSAERGENDKIEKAIDLIHPLINRINIFFALKIEEKIKKAIESGEKREVVVAVQRFICFAITLLLTENIELTTDRSEITPRLREAFAEYLVLDPYVRKIDFQISQLMQNTFRKANAQAGYKPEEFQSNCKEIVILLEHLFQFQSMDQEK